MKLNIYNSYDILIIGGGANGSHFFRNLLQDIATYEKHISSIRITIIDGDKVEKKNITNQLFDIEDIGNFKVFSLEERYAEHYGVNVYAVAEYVTDIDTLHQLFAHDGRQKVLVGCVDNNRTRQLMHEYFEYIDDLIYIDLGVEGVLYPDELPEHFSGDEKSKMIKGSGFSGQVVMGYKTKGTTFLPPVASRYPTILSDEESVFPTQDCAEVRNNPQRLETNKMCAQLANIMLNNLFYTQEILQTELTFNARYGQCNTKIVEKRIERTYEQLFQSDQDEQQVAN